MLGGIPALLARELATTVRRNAAVFGLYLVAAVLVICAAGYGLNALHTVLSELYGSVAASLWIAGGLLLAAVVAVAIAAYVKSRRPPSRRPGSSAASSCSASCSAGNWPRAAMAVTRPKNSPGDAGSCVHTACRPSDRQRQAHGRDLSFYIGL